MCPWRCHENIITVTKETIMNRVAIVVLAFVLALSACSQKTAVSKEEIASLVVDAAQGTFQITHKEIPRSGRIHIPPSYDAAKPSSLVFALHGKGSRGGEFQRNGFDPLADRYNFIMVYPDGLYGEWDIVPGMKTWKDDPGFFKLMIAAFCEKYSIDASRIYATGHSMGGYMCYRLAHDMPGVFAAIAPVSGLSVIIGKSKASAGMSLLHIHALDDTVVSVKGGLYPEERSAEDSVLEWVLINDAQAVAETSLEGGGRLHRWSAVDNTTIELRLNAQGGHVWPADASEIISNFFSDHRREPLEMK